MHNDTFDTSDLNGFKKCSVPIRDFYVSAALSSRPAETVLLEVLQDDRLLLHGQQYWAEAQDEISYLQTLPDHVWQRMVFFVSATHSASRVRSTVLQCAYASVSYIYKEVFAQLYERPLNLFHGDLDVIFASLEDGGGIDETDLVARKLRFASTARQVQAEAADDTLERILQDPVAEFQT